MTRIGQSGNNAGGQVYAPSETDLAAEAAGDAAYKRAKESSWPPTEDDFAAIGAVAATAACAALGAGAASPLCGVIGGAVGGAIYILGDAIASGLDANRADWALIDRINHVGRALPGEYAARLADECGTTKEQEILALKEWGARISDSGVALDTKTWMSYGSDSGRINSALTAFQKDLFAAASARSAQCATIQNASNKSSTAKKLVVTAGIGGLLWFIVKSLRRR
jgi:hypothetical protein